jgi:SNF2 family DNA or RNA helicase
VGLGKTIQTLSFLATLKANGVPGPHLVVTPLAVLQNWVNELKRFTPGLTHCKVHGSLSERDRILSMDEVLSGDFDVYLTTYETLMGEEAFFTESFLFSTITIDEGHRLKNDAGKLNAALARIVTPFRLLLTGTPLQNNLNELWSLLQYILPEALAGCKQVFEDACSHKAYSSSSSSSSTSSSGGGGGAVLDRQVVSAARALLESLMVRRIKSEVEGSLLPKQQFVLKVPLQALQRTWYKGFLDWKKGDEEEEEEEEEGGEEGGEGAAALAAGVSSGGGAALALLSRQQLQARIMQLQKVINHPKCVLLTLDRDRIRARDLAKRAEGSEFVTVPKCLEPLTPSAAAAERELRSLVTVESLTGSCGKLALLDRLLRVAFENGSRCLVFSQFTLTLDVLEEYCGLRFGPEGTGYLR